MLTEIRQEISSRSSMHHAPLAACTHSTSSRKKTICSPSKEVKK